MSTLSCIKSTIKALWVVVSYSQLLTCLHKINSDETVSAIQNYEGKTKLPTKQNKEGDETVMKSTGIIRRIDDLGRIVIPRDIRRTLHIKEGDPLEVFIGEGGVTFRKYNPTCDAKKFLDELKELLQEDSDMKRKPEMMAKVEELETLLKAEQDDFDMGK